MTNQITIIQTSKVTAGRASPTARTNAHINVQGPESEVRSPSNPSWHRKLTKAHHAYCQAPRLSYQHTQSELTHPRPPGLRRTGGSAAVFSQVKGLQCSATTGGLLQSVSSAPLRSTLGTALGFRSAQAKEADDNG